MLSSYLYDRIEFINREQKRQIEIHKWISSERVGYDRGDEAKLEWVEKYAPIFRRWAEKLPYTCVRCRERCSNNREGMCYNPFDVCRIEYIEKDQAAS
jgi:hypothetical protein